MLKQRIEMRDHSAEGNLFFRRTLVAYIGIVVLMLVLLGNLYYLQVESYDTYQTRSNSNRIRVVPVAPPRGLIYDTNGVLLAENRPVYSLEIVPEETKDLEKTADQLITLLGLPEGTKEKFLAEVKRLRRFKPVPLYEKLTEYQVALFSVNQHNYPGASIEAYLKRYYPFGDALTHALGYVAKINTRDVERLEKEEKLANYAATKDIGKQGVEKYYEDELHGVAGYQEVEVNNRGRIVRTLKFQPPIPGKDIYLNIDVRMQLKAQQLLAGQRGAIVMMDPKTGAILALESSPSYDPNLFVTGISSANYSALLNDPARPLVNRTTQGIYAPASTVKPMMSIMGLNEGAITPGYRYFGGPSFSIPGTTKKFRDWRRWGHGWLDVYRAIEVSADTYFYDLAYRVGIDKIHSYMTKFGFGQYTGVDLYEETKGVMPSRDWKMARWRQPWYQGDTISVGIGQGYWSATPLQLAKAISILTQNGHDVTPHLLKSTASQAGVVDAPINPNIALKLKNDSFWKVAQDGMWRVNHGNEGSGRHSFAKAPYSSGGKSGTAQVVGLKENQVYNIKTVKAEHRDNALFVAYAPFEAPKAVVALVLENSIGGGGGRAASPIARQMLDAYLLPPDPQLPPAPEKPSQPSEVAPNE
ncbi:penicillin-binding protein 2 [Aeromonas veronii bv. sobria]|uniref:Peptidoglycan D,D-transpeptidase MrdA n=1 Tax=Aeromonas veronii TaxID=654 RepID=A0ABY3MJ58_AERVE|nr:penicillin-binding protein 2 [Aeromonas veronii]RDU81804.1 penicillin-binding protein 2 [Aeromonas veronii]RDU82349.1 penicillin-binding protein 2 [Aeromonas veronii]TEY48358.1 penicillin-binding protein 2 [Aeromonas veronii]TEY75156.1 penicillin-binding protein 2 [Aeromonas veronii]TYD41341.1 penicillin-binding protein 2 [Aeromonas veronii]